MQEWKSFLENAHLIPMKFIRQCWQRDSFSYLDTPRPDYGLMLLRSGAIDFIYGRQKLCAMAGDVIFLPKGCFYKAIFHTECGEVENDLINFEAEPNVTFAAPTRLFSAVPTECAAQFSRLTEPPYRAYASMPERKSALYALIAAVFDAATVSGGTNVSVIKKAQSLLQEKDTLSVRELARLCCISESGLRSLFTEMLGISPVQYRTNIKLQKAKYLLQATNLTVREIAEMLQFSTEAYFCKCFRKHTGITPKQYANRKRL